ncbi:biotin-dependent carboxyltransferase family protein [uncultured Roseobacter sp.]|uniref:5-oxoprolinase subunit C family protein n=1 Tax=uncultured Roseobacter sp. TaxID=114847 RepID=UPI002607F70D|nr:biotin-dependent carboxyltransferase family protein [uncultured Roseobacter sp.]
MSGYLKVLTAGPAMSLQDMGRSGYFAHGLTRGGAADTLALHEGAALLGQSADLAAIEMVGMGGTFEASADTVVALTGAVMTASIDGAPLVWNASYALPAGAKLTIGGAQSGACGYLHVAGGFDAPVNMGARGSHLKAGIGGLLKAGDDLPLGAAGNCRPGYRLPIADRLSGGTVRVVESAQTNEFSRDTIERFSNTEFRRDARGNRQGVRMDQDGEGFFANDGLSIVSEVIVTGDIQVTGDGAPYVLMCESQTTGGYPRIATVIPSDLPLVAQAPVGAPLRFEFVSHEEARALESRARAEIRTLPGQTEPLVRDPHDIADLLSYQLISGAVSALADPFNT